MHHYALAHLTDDTLLAELATLVATDRKTTAALLAHIGEVDARELFLPAACSSMFVYCTRVLHLADEVAFKRIRVARVARRFPAIFEAIADGRLHVSGIAMLAPHLTDDNAEDVLAAAAHRSKTEIELLIARLAPRPDRPDAINPVPPPSEPAPTLQLDPDPVAPSPEAPARRVKPLSPDRFALEVTISQGTRDKLERAQALLRHRNPSGGLADVLDRALDALLVKLEKEKFGATSRPRATRARTESSDAAYVVNEVRRAVHERDGEQCTFVSADGVRCTERAFLERDHRTPVALGGQPTVDEIRTLCRAHNQYEAERLLGRDFMRAKREAAAAARATRKTAAAVDASPAAPFEPDVTLALCGMGFKPAETRRAMEDTACTPATTFEERLRAALAALMQARGFRASEAGPFDAAARRMAVALCA